MFIPVCNTYVHTHVCMYVHTYIVHIHTYTLQTFVCATNQLQYHACNITIILYNYKAMMYSECTVCYVNIQTLTL